ENSNSIAPQSAFARQWQTQVNSLRRWTTNRIGSVVVAGGFKAKLDETRSARVSKEQDLATSFLAAPFAQTVFASGMNSPADARPFWAKVAPNWNAPPGVVLGFEPATCDLDLNPAYAASNSTIVAVAPPQHQPQVSTTNTIAPAVAKSSAPVLAVSEHSE